MGINKVKVFYLIGSDMLKTGIQTYNKEIDMPLIIVDRAGSSMKS